MPAPQRVPSAPVHPAAGIIARQRPGSEYVTSAGLWQFTRHQIIDPGQTGPLYELYRAAFDRLRTTSAARQVLTEAEFAATMADHRVDKYLAHADDGQTVGITTLTRHLESVPWISPQFYAARFPDYWARNAVYYLGFVLVHPSLRHSRFLDTVIEIGMAKLTAERAMVAYDVCAFNNEVLRFSGRVADLMAANPVAKVTEVDQQVYYAATFD